MQNYVSEEWKVYYFNGEPSGIEVSSLGNVRFADTKKYIALTPNTNGYLKIYTTELGIQLVHRLIASTFVENDDPAVKTDVHHIDGNKFNNSAENLQWIDKVSHAEITYFENHPDVTPQKIIDICKDISEAKLSLKKIAKKYEVEYTFVYRIFRRNIFCKLSYGFDFSNVSTKNMHKNHTAYIVELEKRILGGEPRCDIIQWLMNEYGLKMKDAEYIHDRRRQVLLTDKHIDTSKISPDQKEKYKKLFFWIESELLNGIDKNDLTRIVMSKYPDLGYNKSRDLVKQRARAILENKRSLTVDLAGREKDVERLRRQIESKKKDRHIDKYAHLYTMVERRLLDGEKFMSIAKDLMVDYDLSQNVAKNIVNKRIKALKNGTSVLKPVGYENTISNLEKR